AHVEDRDASGHLVQRVAQRQTEVLLLERLLELRADRFLELVGDHAKRRLERVTGADRARQEVERLGELLLEALQAPRSAVHEPAERSEEHTSELQSRVDLVCRLLLEKKKKKKHKHITSIA